MKFQPTEKRNLQKVKVKLQVGIFAEELTVQIY
jgi:hypothetical protein